MSWLMTSTSLPALIAYQKPDLAVYKVHEWVKAELKAIRLKEELGSLLKPTGRPAKPQAAAA